MSTIIITLPYEAGEITTFSMKPVVNERGHKQTVIEVDSSEHTWASDRIHIIQQLLTELILKSEGKEGTLDQLNIIRKLFDTMYSNMIDCDEYHELQERLPNGEYQQ